MNKSLAILNGVFIALMISFNSLLSQKTGPYFALLIINSICLILVLCLVILNKPRLSAIRRLPKPLMLSGLLGVLILAMNNYSFSRLGATLTMGLMILGQLVFSVLVDSFGLLGMRRHPFRSEKILGLIMMSFGILVMILY